jgi:type IV secretion system protein VirD4
MRKTLTLTTICLLSLAICGYTQDEDPAYYPPPQYQFPQIDPDEFLRLQQKEQQRQQKKLDAQLKKQQEMERKQQSELTTQIAAQKKADEEARKKQIAELEAQKAEEDRKAEEAIKKEEAINTARSRNILIAAGITISIISSWLIFLAIQTRNKKNTETIRTALKLIPAAVVAYIFLGIVSLLPSIYQTATSEASKSQQQTAFQTSGIFGGTLSFVWTIIFGILCIGSTIVASVGYVNLQKAPQKKFQLIAFFVILTLFFAPFLMYIFPLLGVISFGISAIISAGILYLSDSRNSITARDARHGTARFMETEEIAENFSTFNQTLPKGAFYLSPPSENFDEAIALKWEETNKHGVILGGTGTGKSRGYFMPMCALSKGTSLVVTDPKSELWNLTSGYREKALRFAPTEPDESEGFNWIPLCNNARIAELSARAIIESGNTGKTDQFWLDAETAFLAGIFAHTATSEAPTPLTAYRFFSRQNPKAALTQLKNSESDVAREQAIIFEQTDSRIQGSIVPAIAAKLQFLRDDATARFTSATLNPFDFTKLRSEPIAIYYCMPERDLVRLRPLTSLFFTLLLEQLGSIDPDENSANVPIIAMLDEFANIGKIPNFETTITLARGRGIGLWLALQARSQLDGIYGTHHAKTIWSNTTTKVALHSLDNETAEAISKTLGDKTESYSRKSFSLGASIGFSSTPQEHRRPLLTPDEVTRIEKDEAIIRTSNLYPLKLSKGYYNEQAKKAIQKGLGKAIFTAFKTDEEKNITESNKENLMFEV